MAGVEKKRKVVNLDWSNIAGIGSDLDRRIRKAAADTEEAWREVGKESGVQVWRVEKFQIVPWPKEEYGKFYEGDSYVILRTQKVKNVVKYDVFFWLGFETSCDEAGTAAYKACELDDYLDTAPVQHREVQGHESDEFLGCFHNHAITILSGGIESGFRRVDAETYRPRLLHVKGKMKCVRITEVPLCPRSLNSGDVFILDLGLHLYQMNGRQSSGGERIKAGQLARAIDDERKGLAEVHVAEEGDGDPDFWAVFWAALGGEGPISSPTEDASATAEASSLRKLLRVSDETGAMRTTLVAKGKFDRSQLNSNDVMILDMGFQLFVWVGKGANSKERKYGMRRAMTYLFDYDRPLTLP
eukprot:CAMPEP_0119151506 /NCGR_PEP_ID=MMETSP1310-20130426/46423_1 /TAXON_ID=464262 /ORGANISM="Genus nov. species nov., Strain RCC2339" /LENGTH=356 /DNA_ID=CAMNT_0007143785 /DNA_START=45 /DNA_END=1111 /DNA_ORIENTATION=+